ncbi:MAG: hypothetical protein K9G59_00355 [Caulobacter sp.]|nr:hypothetical protein [Caulobacter sp.]
MNGDARTFWRTVRLALLASAASGLTACAGLPAFEPGAGAAVDPKSAAAAEVAGVISNPGPWPTFAGIPEVPEDVRTSAAWRAAIEDQEAEGLYTARSAAPDTWSLTATEDFEARARAEANPLGLQAPTDAEMAESEAYARALRKRATPPPSPR